MLARVRKPYFTPVSAPRSDVGRGACGGHSAASSHHPGFNFSHISVYAPRRAEPLPAHGGAGFPGVAVGGVSREIPFRSHMESSFDESFSGVRAFTGERAALNRLGAGAAAAGETVIFASERPSKWLVAHELAHVVQQRRQGTIPLVGRSGHDGAAERDADRAAFASVGGGRAHVSAAPGGLLAFSPKNPFDDPKAYSNGAEAAKAMTAYQALPESDRRAAVAASYRIDLVRVLRMLSSTDSAKTFVDPLREILRWVEELETRASAGMTDDQIAGEQAKFIVNKAAADAQAAAAAAAKLKKVAPVAPTAADLEKARKEAVLAQSIKPSTTTWWAGLSPAEQNVWMGRGKQAVADVVKYAAVKHPELALKPSDFVVDFPGIEKRGLNVMAAGNPALIGKTFVESAALSPAYVMDVVVHEIHGHPEYGVYGTEYHQALYDAAATKIPGYVKPAAGSEDRRVELDAYAYQETEIYAVLRSMSYHTAPTAKDSATVPNLDTQALVDMHMDHMKAQWAPKLILGILRGLRKRLTIDPRISAAALTAFDVAVERKFDKKMRAAVAA